MDLPVGTVVARSYEILGPLGRGGMGELFIARNVRTERRVALKMLRPDVKQRQDAIERFRREARATGMVSSDHVTQVLDVEEDPVHGIAIAFELLEGESMLEFLRRTGPMTPEALAPYIRQILRGLSDAHSAGVIHRDLKPSNIFLERRNDGSTRVKILDFGISKLPRSMVKVTLTEPNQSLGSFMFMPPEQIQGAKDVDERADIYAVGTLIFQSLTGQLPFATTAVAELVRVKTRGKARTLREASGRVFPELLEAFLQKTLQPDRAARFQTVLEMLSAWDQVTATNTSTAYPPPSSGQRPNMNPAFGQTVPFRPQDHAPAVTPQAQPNAQALAAQASREDMAQTLALPSVRPMMSPFAAIPGPGGNALPATTVQPLMSDQGLAPSHNPYAAYGGQAPQPQQQAQPPQYGAPPPQQQTYGQQASPVGMGSVGGSGPPSGYLHGGQQGYGQPAPQMGYQQPPAQQPPQQQPMHPGFAQSFASGQSPYAATTPPPYSQNGAARQQSGMYGQAGGQATATPLPGAGPLVSSQADVSRPAATSWGPPWLIALVVVLVIAAVAVVGVVIVTALTAQ